MRARFPLVRYWVVDPPGQGPGALLVADRITDLDIFDARQHHNVSGLNFIDVFYLHALVNLELQHFERHTATVFADAHQIVFGSGRSVKDFPDGQPAQVIRITQIRYQHLKRRSGIMGRAGNHIQDGVEKHMQVLSLHIQGF